MNAQDIQFAEQCKFLNRELGTVISIATDPQLEKIEPQLVKLWLY